MRINEYLLIGAFVGAAGASFSEALFPVAQQIAFVIGLIDLLTAMILWITKK